ncbi:GNAT family N-acetyltransferase [Glycomyces luteolus]|uniref:GNAT family N-acetyltransferase n=2 Tax=Glycomyces luteolus TaxID=2670330 RepID=A0A9X3PPJ6_9ACTN|nr:GNAT family N-acetyltransferase [Glycomyces luteolus]MDA1362750.1 GNAT family N-acetyltransferase [Glycomyces luteolus]
MHVLTSDDWRLWRELRLAALAEAPDAFASRLADWQDEGDREERWRSRLAMPGSHNLVAEADGRPVGMASGVPAGDPLVRELIAMWVSPKARGAGVGDALILGVARWARASGAARLRLAVYEHNAAAKALYQRNGFNDTAAPSDSERGAERFMIKPLGDRV